MAALATAVGLAGDDPSSVIHTVALMAFLACPLLYLVWLFHALKWFRVRDVVCLLFWVSAVDLLFPPVIRIAGSTSFPLVDRGLASIDASVLQTRSVVLWIQAHPAAFQASQLVYLSLMPLVAVSCLIPPLCRHSRAAQRFVLSAFLALWISIAIFAIWPAVGPWTVEGYPATKAQAVAGETLLSLKSHSAGALQTEAIVSFPSYHTALAILCAFALRPIRWARWSAVVLAAGICVSTVTTGWHYGIDVIAGVVVAMVSQRVTRAAMGSAWCSPF